MIASWLRVAAVVLLTATGASPQTAAQQLFQQGLAYQTGAGDVEVDLEVALRFYLQALQLDPAFYEAYANAGQIFFARKDYRRAKKYLSDAIRMARSRTDIPKGEEAALSSDLGGCFYQEGNLRKAEEFFRGALGLDAGLVEAHYNLINLLLKQKRLDAARRQIQEASRQAPSTRYGIFEGRLKTQDSYVGWNPWWLWYAIGGVAGGAGAYALLRSVRGQRRKRS